MKKTLSLLIALIMMFGMLSSPGAGNIALAADGVVSREVGNIRVQALSESLVRIELKGPGGFEDRPSYHIVNRSGWPGADMTVTAEGGVTKLAAGNYVVVVPNDATSLSGVYVLDKRGTEIWRYSALPSASLYLPAPGATPKAWAIADNPRAIPAPWGYRLQPPSNTQFTDYNGWDTTNNAPDMFIFVPGGDAKLLRDEFTSLTGPSDLIPIKSLGLWHSRYYAYTEQTALAHIDRYHAEGFPLDYFVVDTDWRTGASLGYVVNTNYFPNMPRFIQSAHDKNVQVMFNDHPEPVMVGGSRAHSLRPEEVDYRNRMLRSIHDMGLDVWWYDRNWSTVLISPFAGVPKESFGMYLYQAIAADYWEDNKGDAPYARRPFIMGNVDGIDNGAFNNPPNIASHRFSHQWTGDNHVRSSDLQREIVNAVKSGAQTSSPYISSDISGHNGVAQPDQWTRWTQFAAFSPFIRYHCTSGNNLDRSPWLYGARAQGIAQDYIAMRYRLLPLFYSLAAENYDNGMPLLRRLDFNYPQYAESQDDTQYTLGDSILVAPIWEAGVSVSAVPGAWLSYNGQPGLNAQFYNNVNLTGTPVLTRIDTTVDFNWGTGSPGTGVNVDNFSARWSGNITIGANDVKLAVTSDDGVRLFIDGERIVNNWNASDSVQIISDVTLAAGSTHSIIIEYYEGTGNAVMRLQYADVSSGALGNSRDVFIPDGRWIDVWSGDEFVGPQTITTVHELETSPIFVRSGSIIPLAENVEYIGEKPWSTIGLDVYPSIVLDGTAELYEDDGDSIGYREGQYRKTPLSTSSDNNDILVSIGAAAGSFDGSLTAITDTFDGSLGSRAWKVRVHAPASWGALLGAKLDGADVTAVKIAKSAAGQPFAIEGASRDADVYEIMVASSSVLTPHEIRLTFASPVAEDVPEIGGIPVDFDAADTIAQQSVNLTTAGEWDWAHYGTDGASAITRKRNVPNRLIGNLKINGTASVAPGYTEFRWTDGDGSQAGRDFILNGLTLSDGSFEFDVNVGTTEEKITIYIGGDRSSGKLTVTDGKSARFADVSNIGGQYARKVTISAVADEPAVLRVKFAKTGGAGNIALYAVAVSSPGAVSDIPIERFVGLEPVTGAIDLSTGSADWVHLGYSSNPNLGNQNHVNRKAGVNMMLQAPVISASTLYEVHDYNASNNADNGGSTGINYSGGADPVSVSNSLHAIATPNGNFQISAPSTNTWRRLKIYCGAWNATNRVEVVDESGVDLSVYTFSGTNPSTLRCINIVYRSEEDSNIIVKMTMASGSGNISLCGYALYEIGAGDVSSALEPITMNINLNGAADWAHYRNTASVNRKAGVANPILTNPTNSGGLGNVGDYSPGNGITYSDGTSPVSVTGETTAVQNSTTGGWLEFEAQSAPGSAWRRLDVYLGVWNACNRIEVMDASRNLLATYEYSAGGSAAIRRLGVLYRDSGGKIIVRMTKRSGAGNVSLAAYAVYDIKSVETSAAVTVEPAPAGNLTLSDPVYTDWAHFGYQAADRFNHKSAGTRMIGNPSGLINQGLDRSNDFTTVFSWTGGAPNATVNNTRDFSYSFDGMKVSINVQPGVWKFSVYTSVWWAKGYLLFEDETGHVIGVADYESKYATAGTSEYRRVNLIYSSDEAHTITVRNMPALAFDGHRGNMSFAAITAEQYIDHVSIDGGGAPNIRDTLQAKAYVSPDDSLEFFTYDGVGFRWQRSASFDGPFEDIAGANAATYKPSDGDVGLYLRVVATFAGKTVSRVTSLPVHDLVFDPVFIDGKGNELTSMDEKPLLVTLKYYNRPDKPAATLSMILAVYDENGRLKSVDRESLDFEPDDFLTFEVPISLTTIEDGDFARVFLWEGYIPVRGAYTFS